MRVLMQPAVLRSLFMAPQASQGTLGPAPRKGVVKIFLNVRDLIAALAWRPAAASLQGGPL
eukprot:CAMPEP_0202347858 /NCGR_PEP_ID=MMETSP1126-20121109/6045_1 /ASSEMBLY_ACC=CAM_ASM_000457 /TAXON_ID=3047 /ORGANISM="Dunaliella tertiolecta, Strain CCMP1320" /LENGTH=60 /DNA_ID=CAMNT_0048939479 /DNA_START=621 /DNA_END=803 /DNA_ORIENTATION=+